MIRRVDYLASCVCILCLLTKAAQGFLVPTRTSLFQRTIIMRSQETGEVGSGPNWIERSFPVDTDETVDPKKVEDYNLGLNGVSYQVGPLSKRMYDTIMSQTTLPIDDPQIQRAFKLYAMDFTAKEACRAALKENGLELVLSDDEQDEGMWGDIDSIRLLDLETQQPMSDFYESWEDVVDQWTPGQGFNFVCRQVPAKLKELTLDELLQALDPDGSLREQAKDAGMRMPDEEIASLKDMANENVRRTEMAPREAVTDAFAGIDNQRGYQVIQASDLLYDSMNANGTENRKTLMHVMEALVSHGCLVVDLTDHGSNMERAKKMAQMWKTTKHFFDQVSQGNADTLAGMKTVEETGSRHAKVGYASYENGNLQFLETRLERETGNLLPNEAQALLGPDGPQALQDAFDVVASVGKDIVRIAVAASSMEAGALQGAAASEAAAKLACELLDDGKPLIMADIRHSEGSVSMSPHRLCRYSNPKKQNADKSSSNTREIFGAHTDSTFVTAVPVAAVLGLEVFDEAENKWFRPELAAWNHWEKAHGNDVVETIDGEELPWHARYLVVMPGELLQLATRCEVDAAVHRVVVATKDSRLSAPILLRGRPGTTMDTARYLGVDNNDSSSIHPLLQECHGMTIEMIHDAMQPASFA